MIQDKQSDTLCNFLHHVIQLASQRVLLNDGDGSKQQYTHLLAANQNNTLDTLAVLRFVLEALNVQQRHAIVQRDYRDRTPLHYAVEAGLPDHCNVLLDYMVRWGVLDRPRSEDPPHKSTIVDDEDSTPFDLGITNDHKEAIRSLLSSNELVKYCWGSESQISVALAGLLHITIASNANDITQILLDSQRVNLGYQGPRNETAHFIASRQGSCEQIELLRRASPLGLSNLNTAESSYGWSPLIVACVQEKPDAVKLLTEMGADQTTSDVFGWTASDHAAFRGFWKISKLLEPASRGSSLRVPKFALSITNALPLCSPSITRVFVNLGPLNTRKTHAPVDLSPHLSRYPHTPFPEVGYSVTISGLGMDGAGGTLTLPILDDTVNCPLVFETENIGNAGLILQIFRQSLTALDHKVHIETAVALLKELRSCLGDDRESFFRDHVLPIIGHETLEYIGTVTVNFLLAKPFPEPRTSAKPAVEKKIWCSSGTPRLIGHRGLGMNSPAFKRLQIGENTIQSFTSTIDQGVPYVEVNVQLTRDHVPVIYHDFLMSESGADIAPHNLSFDQFMCISDMQQPASSFNRVTETNDTGPHVAHSPKILHPRSLSFDTADKTRTHDFLTRIQQTYEFRLKGFKGNVRGMHIHDSFTTLEELLRTLPEEVAIDIELKYPMLWEAEDWKMDLYGVEFNPYVDTVLDQVYKHAGTRPILFTSFSPELCILATHKQDTYPVMFLNESNLFPTGDVRASNLQEAIHFARHWNLPGVVMSSEPFVASPKLIKFVQDAGLVCISFGMMNNDTRDAKVQVNGGVDALIVDSVALINDSFKKGVGTSK
ncbi:Glycerophosphoryl diester phosphodiesterase family-domain-containing protein [Phaeosphaeriaceae sp. PMI808]|nr:Glycerophosphoryl diester phosphodiesterase family-domain-containing protein [Phaeosphaeriaceae sp. PMI808]